MRRHSGEHSQLDIEHEIKAQQEQLQEQAQEQLWMNLIQGKDVDAEKFDSKYTRIVDALVKSREMPIKDELGRDERDLVVEDLERHGEYVQGQDFHVELDRVPKIVFEDDVTSITDDEAEFLSKFKGVIFLNHVKSLTPKQAEFLQKFRGVLFVQGLEGEKNDFIEVPDTRGAVHKYPKLEDSVGDQLAQRSYKTFVPILLNVAFYERVQYFRKVQTTVDIEQAG